VVFITFFDMAWLRVAMVPCGLVQEALALRDKDPLNLSRAEKVKT
jgi:hypothetical protein